MTEKDDYLRGLIQKIPLDSPSDAFVDRVMANLQLSPETAPVKTPYFLYVKTVLPYAVLTLILAVVFFTSDLPFLNWLPGKENLLHTLVPYFGILIAGFKYAFASKFVSFGLLIGISAGLLFLIDQWFSNRTTA
jgi:hypothetical protein